MWNTKELDEEDRLGDAGTELKDGQSQSLIRLHPTRRCHTQLEFKRQGKTLAEERMGSVLHEMLYVFLTQYACQHCLTRENWASHGRAWQRIAKKIEEQSLGLLGIEADMGRLTSFLVDWEEDDGLRVSLCDVEACGFWERLG